MQLSRAFWHARLAIEPQDQARPDVRELATGPDGKSLYCVFPPLPAVVLMPFMLLGWFQSPLHVACRLIAAMNAVLFDACLTRLPTSMGLTPISISSRLWWNLFWSLGTVTWHNACFAGDWHLAHAVALAASLIALAEFCGRNRPLIVGAAVGCVMLSRPTAALACLFLYLAPIQQGRWRRLGAQCIGPFVALGLLGWYNAARFGSPFDFGYARMILGGEGKELMERYGQFHPHFMVKNLFWFFLAPPGIMDDLSPPWLGLDPRGMSLFLASPALLYALRGVIRERKLPLVAGAGIGTVICLVPLLMYFNTGYWQFGHRFSMDYMVALVPLVLAGAGSNPTRLGRTMIIASILIQIWGNFIHPVAALPGWLVP